MSGRQIPIERRLAELGIVLPPPTPAAANFVPFVQTGNLLFLSGHVSMQDGQVFGGKVGRDVTKEQAYQAARQVAIDLLGTVRAASDLNRVTRIVKLLGMVNSSEDFTEQHLVINGASDLLVDLFGDLGRHARSAVGMAQLPLNAAIEIEMILEIEA
jgi:enamine deaminase RidA (YjgF/YER057c/UK114 family)